MKYRRELLRFDEYKEPDVFYYAIDREEAAEWFQFCDPNHQRSRAKGRVDRLFGDMKDGFWQKWVPLVAFDKKGRLINGQHVLAAFLKSDLKEIVVKLEVGLPEEAIFAFDKTRKRSLADDLKIEGVQRSGEMGKIAQALWQYESGKFQGLKYWSARGGESFASDA